MQEKPNALTPEQASAIRLHMPVLSQNVRNLLSAFEMDFDREGLSRPEHFLHETMHSTFRVLANTGLARMMGKEIVTRHKRLVLKYWEVD